MGTSPTDVDTGSGLHASASSTNSANSELSLNSNSTAGGAVESEFYLKLIVWKFNVIVLFQN